MPWLENITRSKFSKLSGLGRFLRVTLYKASGLSLTEHCCQFWWLTKISLVHFMKHFIEPSPVWYRGTSNSCWGRLQQLKLNSLERRSECDIIIFAWKFVCLDERDGTVTYTSSERRGQLCVVLSVNNRAQERVRTMIENPLLVRSWSEALQLLP